MIKLKGLIKEDITKNDISVYNMSMYPDKNGRRGVEDMIDAIREKLKKLGNKKSIAYTIQRDGGVVVEFILRGNKYSATFNHAGTCIKLELGEYQYRHKRWRKSI